ncbi:T9SS type A sorting domain-containing protein [Chryseobacterium tongliaoense]|uniref:T9SS type A sorting domain-containing protein n=1 Tax=Chryseobacterium tongliaoense TaxID=3240933 RepID=UPI003515B2E2
MKIALFSLLMMTSSLSVFNAQCTAVNVPYVENFDTTASGTIPSCTAIQAIGTSGSWSVYNSPFGITGRSLYMFGGSPDADSWFYTQGINLQAGKVYKLAFDQSAPSPQGLALVYGTSPINTSMTNVIQDTTVPASSTLEPVSFTFTPSVTGVFYLGFHYKGGNGYPALIVDNISVTLQSTLSTSEVTHLKDDIEVYPNPAKDYLFVKNSKKNTVAEILDISGKVVLSLNGMKEKIDVSQLIKGTYFLVIKNEDGTLSKTKFIKK